MDAFVRRQTVPNQAKQDLLKACVYFCSKDLRPYEAIQCPGFQKAIEIAMEVGKKHDVVDIKEVLPDRTTVSRHVVKLSSALKETVAQELKEKMTELGGGITSDIWTCEETKTSFLSLTVHYIDSNYQLVEKLLETACFSEERHTGKAIRSELNTILEKFCLNQITDRLVAVTDHAANMRCALNEKPVINHITCICHRLNIVLEWVFDPEKSPTIPYTVFDLLKYCKELVTYFKQSGLMGKLSKTLKQEVPTHWLSRLQMLKSVLDGYDEIKRLLLDLKDEELWRLRKIDKKLLSEIVPFLQYFNEAILELESSKVPTLHLVSPIWHKLSDKVCADKMADSCEVAAIKLRTQELMQEKTEMRKDGKCELKAVHFVATALFPKWRNLDYRFCPSTHQEEAYDELKRLMKLFDCGTSEEAQQNDDSMEHESGQSKRPKKGFLADLDTSLDDDVVDPIETELNHYINMTLDRETANLDILEFWQKFKTVFPRLSQVARHILAVPASSASSERDFSICGLTLQQRRLRLNPKSVDSLTFLKANMD